MAVKITVKVDYLNNMSKNLTEKQAAFLAALFDEAAGDVVKAKLIAGYAESTSTTDIVKSLKDEILEATQLFMSRNAPKAAVAPPAAA